MGWLRNSMGALAALGYAGCLGVPDSPPSPRPDALDRDAVEVVDAPTSADSKTETNATGDVPDSERWVDDPWDALPASGVCGDGVLDPEEECDDGIDNSDTQPDRCRTSCIAPACGDGVWDSDEICDDGNTVEDDTCTSACKPGPQPTQPTNGKIVITELMINPERVSDPLGEWIEVQNRTKVPMDLSNCRLQDSGTDMVDLGAEGSLILPAEGTLVFGFEKKPKLNGGAPVALAYTTLLLDNSFDEVSLMCGETLIDEVAYTPLFGPLEQGHSLSLDGGTVDADANDSATAWCNAQVAFGAGDFGTPGVPNPACPKSDTSIDHCVLTSPPSVLGFVGAGLEITVEILDLGLTNKAPGIDAHPALEVQIGNGPPGTHPKEPTWEWTLAEGIASWTSFKGVDGYAATLTPGTEGSSSIAAKASLDGGVTWTYCDRDTGSSDGFQVEKSTMLTVEKNPCDDLSCPPPPVDVCAPDKMTLLSYTDPPECLPTGSTDIECIYVPSEVSCADAGFACENDGCTQEIAPPTTFGSIVFTELFLAPSSSSKTGQWFEVLNSTDGLLNLEGCWFSDGHEGSHFVEKPLVIGPGQFHVLAGSSDSNLNGGIHGSYEFGDDLFLQTGGSGLSLACNGTMIDSLATSEDAMVPTGIAVALSKYKQDAELNDDPYAWCLAEVPFGDGDLGTPGVMNSDCPNDEVTVKNCILDAPTGTKAFAGESLSAELSYVVTEKVDGVVVTPLVEIGFGPAGTSPESPLWEWKPLSKSKPLQDMEGLDESSGVYTGLFRLPGNGAWHIAGRASGDEGKTSVLCDISGSENGFSIVDGVTIVAEPSPCWPDPCGPAGEGVCYENKVVDKLGEATCLLGAEGAECLWTVKTSTDCDSMGGTCELGECSDLPLTPGIGDVIFSELMVVPPPNSPEWIELANLTEQPLLLSGCELLSDVGESFQVATNPTANLVVPPKGFLVLVREHPNAKELLEGAPTYSGVSLHNTSDTLTLTCLNAVVDAVSWDKTWPIIPYESLQLHPDAMSSQDNDQPEAWCSHPAATPESWNSPCAE